VHVRAIAVAYRVEKSITKTSFIGCECANKLNNLHNNYSGLNKA